jgi:dCMP deaminase
MIVGLTGTIASGKGVVSEILQEMGFKYSSTSDRVREEAVLRGNPNYKIVDLQNIGNELREKFGLGELVKRTLKKLENAEDSVIDGIRNLGEIKALKNSGAVIIGVDAPLQTRFQRLIERARDSDPKDWDGFIKMDRRDKGAGEENSGQQVSACLEKADYLINNDSNLEQLKEKIYTIIKDIQKFYKEETSEKQKSSRPSWDEYFMKLAALVAERSTCLRHNIGAVIVKDKRLITTGYNGAAKGVPNCNEVGCIKNKMSIRSGEGHNICQAVHAEMNAIIQGAYHGISVKDCTMYSTHTPCTLCARMIINAGIKKVVSYHAYSDESARELLKNAGVILEKVEKPTDKIKFLD